MKPRGKSLPFASPEHVLSFVHLKEVRFAAGRSLNLNECVVGLQGLRAQNALLGKEDGNFFGVKRKTHPQRFFCSVGSWTSGFSGSWDRTPATVPLTSKRLSFRVNVSSTMLPHRTENWYVNVKIVQTVCLIARWQDRTAEDRYLSAVPNIRVQGIVTLSQNTIISKYSCVHSLVQVRFARVVTNGTRGSPPSFKSDTRFAGYG